MAVDLRKLSGYGIISVLVGILVVQYVRALGPSAQEEKLAPCRAMRPAPFNPRLGKFPSKAPDFAAQDFEGGSVSLAAYRGKVVFLNFWQTGCAPCKVEMPSMERLQQTLGEDAAVVALASENTWDPVRKFFPEGTGMTVLLDPPTDGGAVGAIAKLYGTEKWPETYVIDKSGTVRYYFINAREWDTPQALQCVRALVEE
jgi:cytochrome c biogenesis protein CcmG, thiol:disulfide interchange protein DsbE